VIESLEEVSDAVNTSSCDALQLAAETDSCDVIPADSDSAV